MRTFSGVGSRRRRFDRAVRQHPDVGRFDALAHRDRARVGLVGDAAEAAGHHAPAVRRRGGVDAQHEGARDESSVLPARRRRQPHDLLADVIDAARRRSRRSSAARSSAPSSAATTPRRPSRPGAASLKGAGDRHGIERGENARALAAAGRTTRSRCSASPGPRRGDGGRGAGRNASSARDSTSPAPGMFATATPPARIASTRPGTPSREAALSSSGSSQSASTRRQSTSARFSPAMVRT